MYAKFIYISRNFSAHTSEYNMRCENPLDIYKSLKLDTEKCTARPIQDVI